MQQDPQFLKARPMPDGVMERVMSKSWERWCSRNYKSHSGDKQVCNMPGLPPFPGIFVGTAEPPKPVLWIPEVESLIEWLHLLRPGWVVGTQSCVLPSGMISWLVVFEGKGPTMMEILKVEHKGTSQTRALMELCMEMDERADKEGNHGLLRQEPD